MNVSQFHRDFCRGYILLSGLPSPRALPFTWEGRPPIPERLHTVQGSPLPKNANATASFPPTPRQPFALWLLINPEPPGTGRGSVCQTQLGCHPQSFIMMCLFTDDLDVPFERRSKWPGQKCWGHSIAGATGVAAGMLHCLGT